MSFAPLKKKSQTRIRHILFGYSLLASILVFGLTFWFANYYVAKSLSLDFNVGLYNYAADLSESVQSHPLSDPNISLESYLDKARIFPFQHGQSLVEIYDRLGQQLFRYTLNQNAPQPNSQHLVQLKDPDQEIFYDFSENDIEWRSLVIALDDANPPELILKVTVPLDFLNSQKLEVAHMLGVSALIAVVLLSMILLFVASRITNPLEKLSSEVKNYDLNSTNPPITVPSSPRELAILGERFNELLQRVKKLVTAEKEFAASAAHQLKTPLTIARGHIEMLSKELSGPAKDTALVSINEIDQLAQTVNNLLLLTRVETGISQPLKNSLHLGDLVSQVMSRLSPLALQLGKKFRLNMEVTDIGQLEVISDPHFLNEALRNLLENALRYSSSEVIDVSIHNYDHGLQIEIRNEARPPVFIPEPPYRFSAQTNPGGGHGLGLAISYKLLNLLGYTLELRAQAQQFIACINIKIN